MIPKIEKVQEKLVCWGRANYEVFPWRSTQNDFHALIAEVMLQRTRANQVVPIFNEFVARYPSVSIASKETPERIRRILAGLGLNWRIEKIVQLICAINERGDKIPGRYEELVALPGVGRYVASSYLSLHRNVRMPIIDSNVVRLWSRVFAFDDSKEIRRKGWFLKFTERITPQTDFRVFNYSILDLTRNVCKPKPLHHLCPLSSLCEYYSGSCR
jgi:A/G-specific adenine glycosylase